MAYLSRKNFPAFLLRFQENYLYFASAYTGTHPTLFLDQFIKDQVNMAQCVYGDQYALQVQELASELSHIR